MSGVDAFVVAHNHARTLAVDGRRRSPARPFARPRIVVVDNASADGSVGVDRAALAGTLALEVVASHENRGFTAAANDALRANLARSGCWRSTPTAASRRTTSSALLAAADGAGARRRRDRAAPARRGRGAARGTEPGGLGRHGGHRLRAVTSTAPPDGPCERRSLRPAMGVRRLGRRRPVPPRGARRRGVPWRARCSTRGSSRTARTRILRGACSAAAGAACTGRAARASHERGLKPETRRRGTPDINRHSVRNRFLLRWSNADWRWLVACFPWWLRARPRGGRPA